MTIKVARSIGEIERVRGIWSELQGDTVTSDPDYYLELLRYAEDVQRPHVVVLQPSGKPAGLVVARVEKVRLVSKIGYKAVYRPSIRALRVAYGGLLGGASDELAKEAVGELMAALARGEADLVLFPNLRTDGAAFGEATGRPSFLMRQHAFDVRVHRRLLLPDSYEAFFTSLSRRTREGLRRNERRLLEAHGDELSVRSLDGPGDVDAFFAAALPIAKATYQGSLGVAVRGDDLDLALTRLAAERGWFRARVLYVADQPVAFWHGYAYRGVFQTHVPGYLPAYRQLNVGTYLLLGLLKDLCADPTVGVLDLGFGDAEYKRRLANDAWEEADVAVFAPSFRGIRVNAIRTTIVAANRLGKRALGSGLVATTKRAWRSRMSAGGA